MTTDTYDKASKLIQKIAKINGQLEDLNKMKQVITASPNTEFHVGYGPSVSVVIPKNTVPTILDEVIAKYTQQLQNATGEFVAL